jgi:putative redox protein
MAQRGKVYNGSIVGPRESEMSMRITQIKGHKFKAEYKGVEIVSGRVDEGSPYEGMSPGSLMVAALGMCTGMHIETYLKERGIGYEGIEITVKNRYDRDPPRATEFLLDLAVGADLDEEQRRDLLEEANRCYVGNTMRNGPKISVNLK